jgi:hypothetical protein
MGFCTIAIMYLPSAPYSLGLHVFSCLALEAWACRVGMLGKGGNVTVILVTLYTTCQTSSRISVLDTSHIYRDSKLAYAVLASVPHTRTATR